MMWRDDPSQSLSRSKTPIHTDCLKVSSNLRLMTKPSNQVLGFGSYVRMLPHTQYTRPVCLTDLTYTKPIRTNNDKHN